MPRCEDLAKFRRPWESLMDAYRRLQLTCDHKERDPRGTCYRCGQRKEVEKCAKS